MAWFRVRGHDDIVHQFRQAFLRGRLGHAYLFIGPPGVGKRFFARELAKARLCEKPNEPLTACDRCAACKLMAAETHPDFSIVRTPEVKHELPIDAMREFLRQLGLKPSRGRHKVGFVEDASDFNEESANIFLKTLEEPPPGSLLILRATALETQLSTILSRCQPIWFKPLKDEDVHALLETYGIDAGQRDRLVRLSRGSVGRAIALNDASLWEFRRGLLEALITPKFNHAAFAERWTKFVEGAGKESRQQRLRAQLALQLLVDLLEASLKISLHADSTVIEDSNILQPFAERLGTDNVLKALEACIEADRHVEQNVKVELALELLADRFAAVA